MALRSAKGGSFLRNSWLKTTQRWSFSSAIFTDDQNLELQKIAIEKYAKEKGMTLVLYVEKISTRKTDRTELNHALKATAPGDRFVVYKLDRLARSTKELYQLTDEIAKQQVEFERDTYKS